MKPARNVTVLHDRRHDTRPHAAELRAIEALWREERRRRARFRRNAVLVVGLALALFWAGFVAVLPRVLPGVAP